MQQYLRRENPGREPVTNLIRIAPQQPHRPDQAAELRTVRHQLHHAVFENSLDEIVRAVCNGYAIADAASGQDFGIADAQHGPAKAVAVLIDPKLNMLTSACGWPREVASGKGLSAIFRDK